MRKIHDKLAAVKPGVRLSALALTPTPAMASEYALQEWDVWMRDGLLDFVVPGVYSTDAMIGDAVASVLTAKYDRHMYIGLGTYQINSDVARRQIDDTRLAGAGGVVLFSYHFLVAEPGPQARIGDLTSSVFAESAARPAMSWRQAVPPKGETR